jgi:hypothetical protein
MYEFTQNLLISYNNTGKTFYLGHWEGDWYLLVGYDPAKKKVGDDNIQGMIEWYNIRQKAIDDAKRDTQHANVNEWHYAEANRVTDIKNGSERVINAVLPKTNVRKYSTTHGKTPDVADFKAWASVFLKTLR